MVDEYSWKGHTGSYTTLQYPRVVSKGEGLGDPYLLNVLALVSSDLSTLPKVTSADVDRKTMVKPVEGTLSILRSLDCAWLCLARYRKPTFHPMIRVAVRFERSIPRQLSPKHVQRWILCQNIQDLTSWRSTMKASVSRLRFCTFYYDFGRNACLAKQKTISVIRGSQLRYILVNRLLY